MSSWLSYITVSIKNRKAKPERRTSVKIIHTPTHETVARVLTNRSMTLDEAIKAAGGEIHPEYEDANVKIGKHWYFYEDLEMEY